MQLSRIVFVSSEVTPFSKTGGLADVAGSLTIELASQGHEVYVFAPLYRETKDKEYALHDEGLRLHVGLGNKSIAYSLWRLRRKKVTFYFIKQDEYFDREYLYGPPSGAYADNAMRFAFFAKAALKSLQYLQIQPDIIHCNDWQTALLSLFVKEVPEFKQAFAETKTIFTIHNLLYQGVFDKDVLGGIGLGWNFFHPESLEFYGKVNFMKAGLIYSDVITTVSRSYAKEIQTPQHGELLEGVLKRRRNDLHGIINGVDYQQWNPETDSFIVAPYSEKTLHNKRKCKEDLCRRLGLELDEKAHTLVFGNIGRLVPNKGVDLIIAVIPFIVERNQRLVILGFGDEYYNSLLKRIAGQYPHHVAVRIGFDEPLAHQIEAGADVFLMPSRSEPCGLNQLYSLKYGTIPVVEAVGGLRDTIVDYHQDQKNGNGFTFRDHTASSFLDALTRAAQLYQDRSRWKKLIKRAMSCDFSWKRSAEQYSRLYKEVVQA